MLTILIVEDDPPIRDILTRYFSYCGYHPLTAADGIEGLRVAQAQHPHLIILDMGLPGMDGWTVAKELKASPTTAPIPIVALTAWTMNEDRERALAVGCASYLMKPIDFPQLLRTVISLLST